MYTIKQLTAILGISEATLYNRLREFDDFLRSYRRRNKENNQNLITEDGRRILERIEELRKQGYPFEEIKRKLTEELKPGQVHESPGDNDSQGSLESLESLENLQRRVAMLEIENAQLRERLQELKDRIASLEKDKEWLQHLLQNRLPPTEEEIREKLSQRVSRWERFKQFLKGV